MDKEPTSSLPGNEEFFLHKLVSRIYKELSQGYKRFASENEFPRGERVDFFFFFSTYVACKRFKCIRKQRKDTKALPRQFLQGYKRLASENVPSREGVKEAA